MSNGVIGVKNFIMNDENPKYILKYKDRYFTFVIIFVYIVLFMIIAPLFFINYDNSIFDIISDYFFCGDRYALVFRILSLANLCCFFIYKEHYIFISIGDVYIHDNYLVCCPRLFPFKKKKIFYENACISFFGNDNCINNIYSFIISNYFGRKKYYIDLLRGVNIPILINPALLNTKDEIGEIYIFLTKKIYRLCERDI